MIAAATRWPGSLQRFLVPVIWPMLRVLVNHANWPHMESKHYRDLLRRVSQKNHVASVHGLPKLARATVIIDEPTELPPLQFIVLIEPLC